MKTQEKTKGMLGVYKTPCFSIVSIGLAEVLCSSMGSTVENLNTVQDESSWENLY